MPFWCKKAISINHWWFFNVILNDFLLERMTIYQNTDQHKRTEKQKGGRGRTKARQDFVYVLKSTMVTKARNPFWIHLNANVFCLLFRNRFLCISLFPFRLLLTRQPQRKLVCQIFYIHNKLIHKQKRGKQIKEIMEVENHRQQLVI